TSRLRRAVGLLAGRLVRAPGARGAVVGRGGALTPSSSPAATCHTGDLPRRAPGEPARISRPGMDLTGRSEVKARFATRRGPSPGTAGARGLVVSESSERLQDLAHERGGLGRRLADLDADGLEGLLLGGRGAGRAGHDRARVAHRLALGGGEAGDVTDD